jgi:FkbM family methyltransferase
MHELKRHRNTRTRLINIFRSLLKFGLAERFLSGFTNGKGRGSWIWKIVPPEYLYRTKKIHRVFRDGIEFELDLRNYNDYYLFYGLPEPDLEYMFSLLEPSFVVMDIGANIGFTTLNFARHCRQGHVYAYEPDSLNFAKLKRNGALNHFSNVTIHQCGVGESAGELPLVTLDRHHSGMNRIHSPQTAAGVMEKITVVTLDDEVTRLNIKKVDVIKIDVEGYEWNVLRGATATLQTFKPLLFVELIERNLQEYGHSSAIVVRWLKDLGYRVINARTQAELEEHWDTMETDIVCFPVS